MKTGIFFNCQQKDGMHVDVASQSAAGLWYINKEKEQFTE